MRSLKAPLRLKLLFLKKRVSAAVWSVSGFCDVFLDCNPLGSFKVVTSYPQNTGIILWRRYWKVFGRADLTAQGVVWLYF